MSGSLNKLSARLLVLSSKEGGHPMFRAAQLEDGWAVIAAWRSGTGILMTASTARELADRFDLKAQHGDVTAGWGDKLRAAAAVADREGVSVQ